METEKKYCSGCQRDVKLEGFEEGFKNCNTCREKKRRQYHKNPEKYAEYKKQFKENYPEEYKEQCRKNNKIQRERVKDIMITCPVCRYKIKKYKQYQHNQSQLHQENLRRQERPEDFEKEDEPDERIIVNTLEYDCCHCCDIQMRPWEWRWHIKEEEHKQNKIKLQQQ